MFQERQDFLRVMGYSDGVTTLFQSFNQALQIVTKFLMTTA